MVRGIELDPSRALLAQLAVRINAHTIDLRRRYFCAPPPLNLSAVDRRARTSALPGHEAAIGLPVRVA